MLSGESAKGKYPAESVKFMNEIILSAERYASSGALGHPEQHSFLASPKDRDSAIARAAVTASHERPDCDAILVLTHHGTMPRLIAAFRPHVPIYAFCPMPKIGRQLQLYRGVHPIVGVDLGPTEAVEMAKDLGYLKSGSEVVIVSMDDDKHSGERSGTMKLVTVP